MPSHLSISPFAATRDDDIVIVWAMALLRAQRFPAKLPASAGPQQKTETDTFRTDRTVTISGTGCELTRALLNPCFDFENPATG